MARRDNDRSLRAVWLGQQLRELREAKKMTLRVAGDYIQRTSGTLSRFENGDYPIRRGDVLALLDLYRVSNRKKRQSLINLAESIWQKGWWDGYADTVEQDFVDYVWLESRASAIRAFDNSTMLGLLQTREYAEAAIRAAEPDKNDRYLERGVELRMARTDALTRENPIQLSVILDECVLRRPAGPPGVMRAQLDHLIELAALPNIELRVLPFAVGVHASFTGPFRIFSLTDPYPEVGYAETPGGAIYVETPKSNRFEQTYNRLLTSALDPDRSVKLVTAVAKET